MGKMAQVDWRTQAKSVCCGIVRKLGLILVWGVLVMALCGSMAQANNGQISGTVRNQNGEPVNSVNVTIYRQQIDPSGFVWWQNYQNATTNMSGTYSLTGLEVGVYRIGFDDAVWPRRYLQEYYNDAPTVDAGNNLTVTASAVISHVDAQLMAGGRIMGVVTNESGQPLLSTEVYVYPDPAGESQQETSAVSAYTDANGAYEVMGLPTGAYIVHFNRNFWPSGYIPEYYDDVTNSVAATPVQVTAGATTSNINAQLASTSRLEGAVTNAQGKPLTNIYVTLYTQAPGDSSGATWYQSMHAITNLSGTYSINYVYPGVYRLGFSDMNSPKRYLDEFYDDVAEITTAANITVTSSQTLTGLNAILATGSHLQGVVTTVDGAPLDRIEASVYRYELDPSGLFDWWTTVSTHVTDASGVYRIGGLPPGRYRLGFHDQRSPNEYFPEFYDNAATLETGTSITVTANVTITTNISMSAGGRISGMVTNAHGVPIEDLQVTSYQYSPAPWGNDWNYSLIGATDASGRYQIGGLPAGLYHLEFSDTYSPKRYLSEYYMDAQTLISGADILVAENETIGNINAQLDAAAHITGVVRDLQGAPVANIWVRAQSPEVDGIVYSGLATTAISGTYDIGGLTPAAYQVSFTDSRGWHEYATEYYNDVYNWAEAAYFTVTIGQVVTNVNAMLAPASHITGTVINEVGVPLPNIQVTTYRQRSSGSQMPSAALQNAQVTDSSAVWWEPIYNVAYTNDAGAYELKGLDPGIYRLYFTDVQWPHQYLSEYYNNAGRFEDAQDIAIAPGLNVGDIHVALQSAGRIAGRVTNLQGAGLPNIEARIYRHYDSGWYWYYSLQTDVTGAYDARLAESGDYRVGFFDATGYYAHQYYDGAHDLESAASLTLSQGSDFTNINASLSEAGRITGAVTNANGAPLAGIHAWIYRYANGVSEWLGEAISDQSGVYTSGGLGNERYRLYFFDPTGAHAYEYYDHGSTLEEATDVTGTVGITVANINVTLANPAPPVAIVSANSGSVSVDTHTGEVTIAMPRGNRSDITITRTVTCTGSGLPTQVELIVTIGGSATIYPMTPSEPENTEYHATVPQAALTGNAALTVKNICAGVTDEVAVGAIQLYDPSGVITDAATGQPIQGATVTLYKAPGWRAKSSATDNEPNTCQSNNSKGANEPWNQLAPTEVGQIANPISGAISPAVSAMQTDDVGHYGWDVAAGCWYLLVEAPGYQSKVSPVVGTPPAVTDLNLTLNTTQVAAVFMAVPQLGTLPLTVHFTNTATGPVNAWQWRFGDGAVSSSPNPTHTYTTAGIYAASLTVQGADNSSTVTQTIEVRDLAIGLLHAINSGPTTLGAVTHFSASVTSGSGIVYLWSFGDGSGISAAASAASSHTYAIPGFYTAQVTATNSISQVTATTLVAVKNAAIHGLTAANSSPVLVGQSVHFTATVAVGSNIDYTWDFGDGAGGTSAALSHTYAKAGLYTTTVTAGNSEGMVAANTLVVVSDVAVTDLTLHNDGPTLLGQVSHFTATVANGSNVSYQWNFGDGAIASGARVSHTYTKPGVYTIIVTATNGAGSTTASLLVTISSGVYLPVVIK